MSEVTYDYSIKITDTGMIIAEVFRFVNETKDGRVGLKFYTTYGFWQNKEKILEKAHEWCKDRIQMLERQEKIIT